MRTQKGMTVVELVTASSILLTLSLGVSTFVPAGFKANEKNRKQMVSSQLFNEVMEEVNTIKFDELNPSGSEPVIPSDQSTVLVLDTTPNQVSLNHVNGVPQVSGQTATIGSGTQAITYPRYTRINNVAYRVDLKVIKGRYNDLMASRPFPAQPDMLADVQNFFMPEAVAASSGSVAVQVSPGSTGYKNTTAFAFSTDCANCPPSNRRVYNWNFGLGEGAGSADAAPAHTFAEAGLGKKVFLTITDSQDPNVALSSEVTLDIKDSQLSMSLSNNQPKVGDSVTFSASCTSSAESDCGSNPVYNWTFGDGSTATGQSVTHTYAEAGQYTPAVAVTGGTDPRASQPITVLTLNGKQAALSVSPQSLGVAGAADSPQTTEFVFSARSQGYNNVGATSVNYHLDFGDGSQPVDLVDSTPDDDQFPTAAHKYTVGGSYTVKLDVQPQGLAAGSTDDTPSTTSTTVTARSVVDLQANATEVYSGSSVSFMATAMGVGNNPAYQWSFGDGTSATDYSGQAGHTFTRPGTYTVTVTAMGGTNPSASKLITVKQASSSPGTPVDQSEMKKIFVFVSPWKTGALNEKDVLTTGIYLKGDNH
ncbi:MAG TPA: PKD domain-containing protein [Candidatus Obscuribacterales bacterium]